MCGGVGFAVVGVGGVDEQEGSMWIGLDGERDRGKIDC